MAGCRPTDDAHISHFPRLFVGSISSIFFFLSFFLFFFSHFAYCFVWCFLWHRLYIYKRWTLLRNKIQQSITVAHCKSASDSIIDRLLSSSDWNWDARAKTFQQLFIWKSQTVRLWFRAASTITGHQSLKFLLFSLMNPIHPPIEKTSSSVTCNCCMSFRFKVDDLLQPE
jgi:hypothetical protein